MAYALSGIRLPSASFTHKSCGSTTSHADRRNSNISLFFNKSSTSRKIFVGNSSYDSESLSFMVAASEKVIAPGGESESSSSLTDQSEVTDTISGDPQILDDDDSTKMEDDSGVEDDDKHVQRTSGYSEVDDKQYSVSSPTTSVGVKSRNVGISVPLRDIHKEKDVIRQPSIPPPGTGQIIYEIDPLLRSHREHLDYRYAHYRRMRDAIDKHEGGLEVFSRGYEKFGFARRGHLESCL